MTAELEKIKLVLKEHKQEHLLQYYSSLPQDEQLLLLDEIKNIDFEYLADIHCNSTKCGDNSCELQVMEPVPKDSFGSVSSCSENEKISWEEEGLRCISNSKVAVLVLAGGQGTRLGSKDPKGMFNVGIPSKKSLYQINAERLQRLQEYAFEKTGKRGIITWYIMTSNATMNQTKSFFFQHKYFGLCDKNVVFFEQFTLPCTDFAGNILLAKKSKIATAPDGNGGLYRALRNRYIIDDMVNRGIECVHVHGVDNILQKSADPVFIGFCRSKKADCGAKVVEKVEPHEAVGVVCKVNGVYQVVEYSEISKETSEKRDENERLVFNAGNICNHYFTIDFLKEACKPINRLPHHIAKKKIPFVNGEGALVTPNSPNGIKMEKFVFDVFKFSKNFVVFEVSRDEEFSPLKNAEGASSASPRHARWSLASLHHRQIKNAGGIIVDNNDKEIFLLSGAEKHNGEYPAIIEISPLLSYNGENLVKLVKDKQFRSPIYLDVDLPKENGNC